MPTSAGGAFIPSDSSLASPTITSPTISGTVSGSATYSTPTLSSPTITSPTITGTTSIGAGATLTSPTFVTPALGVPASGTLGGMIYTDIKVLAANATYSATVTPATLTGFSWTVVAGTYVFEVNLPATMTTNGGLTINFLLTTAVLTSIQYETFASTADVAGTGVTTNGTTTTSGTKVFDNKTAAYTHVNIKGSMVVGTGGTFAWQGCQNTSAGAGDATIVAIGSFAELTRVA